MLLNAFDDGASDLLGDPLALGLPGVEGPDAGVAEAGVVVAGVDDRDVARQVVEQVLGQGGHGRQRDREHDDLGALDRSPCIDGSGADLLGHLADALDSAGVRETDVVAQLAEGAGEGPADVACADDADLHVVLLVC
nr:hypothetical protein [Marmoricola sp. Leaf446]